MSKTFRAAPYVVPIDEFRSDPLFRVLAHEIVANSAFPEIRDSQLYIRNDGLIINADGWYHPDSSLIGTVMYAPDKSGTKNIFGRRYQKLTLYPGTYTPIPFSVRAALYRQYDRRFAQPGLPDSFALYKQVIPRSEIVAYISGEHVYNSALPIFASQYPEILDDIRSIGKIIGVNLEHIQKGFTGAPSLGNYNGLHDLDIVFSGDLKENSRIAKAIRHVLVEAPGRRLFEGGKGWNIRFFNDRQTLVCCFFTYKDAANAPLRKFTMETIRPFISIEGTVVDDTHAIYLPTFVVLANIKVLRLQEHLQLPDTMPVIVYHAASRGDCFVGDRVRARGQLVQITTATDSYVAICIVEREGLRNLTPTWKGYYV